MVIKRAQSKNTSTITGTGKAYDLADGFSIANLSSKRRTKAPDSDDLEIEEISQEETDTDMDITKTSDAFEYIGKSVYSVTGS